MTTAAPYKEEMLVSIDPFHEGERRVQRRVGQVLEADGNSPMIGSRIPGGAISFLQQQSLLVLAVLDHEAMWCLPIVGKAGWMTASRDAVQLDLGQMLTPVDERILHAAEQAQLVGGVVLDFANRRRLRINGRLTQSSERQLLLSVAEAYPNCPKYITQRSVVWDGEALQPSLRTGTSLTEDQRRAFRKADLLFLATQHPERGLDASHRGGNPGFVESPSGTTLRFPDYSGNSLFNTLGNLEIDSRLGLLLPDFDSGRALAITGTAAVSYEDDGQNRWMTVTVQGWSEVPFPARERMRQLSPFNP